MEQFLSAIGFARQAHNSQRRLDGRAFLSHPLAVMQILLATSTELPRNAYISGLLHDTLEDGNATREQIVTSFGEEVADVVAALTRPRKPKSKHHYRNEGLYITQMVEANKRYPYVLLIKMADRLHSLETAHFLPAERRETLINESLFLYLPVFLVEKTTQYAFNDSYHKLLELIRNNLLDRASHG